MESEQNVLDALLLSKNYIILFSGLKMSPIDKVVDEMTKSFNACLLDFMHLPLDSDLSPMNTRVKELMKQGNKMYIIKGQAFDKSWTKIPVDLHINLSINDKTINDVKLSTSYKSALTRSYINKYFNFKPDTNMEQYLDNIFWYIVDDIEKKVYKKDYDRLNHKNDLNDQEKTVIVSDPNSKSREELNNEALAKVEEEIDDAIFNDSPYSLSSYSDT